jgi:pyruvate dehydrogenase E1 component alpha subunit
VPLEALYRQMLRMRRFEELLARLWERGRVSGELHLGIGEEGIVAGVVDHVGDGDALALDHRSTPAMVGRGTDLELLALEMIGDAAGLCGGRGGHMHLFDPERLVASSGIVGASGPLACGFALGADRLRPGRIAVAFLGESAINQGMMMESMNLAAVWRLPVLFVVKDNGWAITTWSPTMTAGSLRVRAKGLGVRYRRVDGRDVAAVWRTAGSLIEDLRSGRSPAVLHATCRRPRGHFEGDPLVRMVTDTRELSAEVGPLVRAFAKPGAASLGGRIAGLRDVGAAAVRMRIDLVRPWDPIRTANRWLDPAAASRVRAQVEAEIGPIRSRLEYR